MADTDKDAKVASKSGEFYKQKKKIIRTFWTHFQTFKKLQNNQKIEIHH